MRVERRLQLLRLRLRNFSFASSSSLSAALGLERPRHVLLESSLIAESIAMALVGRAPVTYHDPSARCLRDCPWECTASVYVQC
jgi:hypothetical protein